MFVLITVMCAQMGPGEVCHTEIAPAFFHSETQCRDLSGRATVSAIQALSKTELKPTRVDSFCHEMKATSG